MGEKKVGRGVWGVQNERVLKNNEEEKLDC